MNLDTTAENDELIFITDHLLPQSPEDPSPTPVGTLLQHDTIIGWTKLSIEAQDAIKLKYPTIESSTSETFNNEVHTTGCVTILCHLCSNYVQSFPCHYHGQVKNEVTNSIGFIKEKIVLSQSKTSRYELRHKFRI